MMRRRALGEDDIHLDKTSARAGTTPHVVRYMLMASLTLVVILFALLLFYWR